MPQAEDVAELMQDGPVFRVGEMHGGLVFRNPQVVASDLRGIALVRVEQDADLRCGAGAPEAKRTRSPRALSVHSEAMRSTFRWSDFGPYMKWTSRVITSLFGVAPSSTRQAC